MADTGGPAVGRRAVIGSAAADLVLVLLFVVLGRSSHDEGGSFLGETVKVVAPFWIALALGWVAARAWRSPTSPTTGMVIWVVTLVAGMILRHFAFDRGTATAFVIVAGSFTLLFLVGWRFLWEWRSARR